MTHMSQDYCLLLPDSCVFSALVHYYVLPIVAFVYVTCVKIPCICRDPEVMIHTHSSGIDVMFSL